jgi:hypothetical protein
VTDRHSEHSELMPDQPTIVIISRYQSNHKAAIQSAHTVVIFVYELGLLGTEPILTGLVAVQ